MKSGQTAAITTLTEINLDDILVSLGWQDSRLGRSVVRALFYSTAEKFARNVLDFDSGVAEGGLAEGSRRLLARMVREVIVEGAEHIPPQGPLLLLSNHPGLTDTIALFSCIPRPDLRVLAAERPFLQALTATSHYLINIPEGNNGRLDTLRAAAAHLRAGGTILTFPAGKIEPDPAALPGTVEALDEWIPSIGLFARLVPETQIMPVVVSGVLAPQSLVHPLTHLRRQRLDRERLAAAIQLAAVVMKPDLWQVTVRIRFAPPIPAADLTPLREPEAITRAITARIRPFLEEIIRRDARKT